LAGEEAEAKAKAKAKVGTESYSTTTRSDAERPNVSGMYISSAFVGGTMNVPGVVARAT
jgi:hypothetical protein